MLLFKCWLLLHYTWFSINVFGLDTKSTGNNCGNNNNDNNKNNNNTNDGDGLHLCSAIDDLKSTIKQTKYKFAYFCAVT